MAGSLWVAAVVADNAAVSLPKTVVAVAADVMADLPVEA